MKTNTYKPNRLLVLFIYLIAFVLMTFSFHTRAEEPKTEAKSEASATTTKTETTTESKKEAGTEKAAKKDSKKSKKAAVAAKKEKDMVVIDTNMGKITVKLNEAKAPITVGNFFKYVANKHYDGTIFHRVMKDFMIQGGGHTPDMKEKKAEYPSIKNEADNGLFNKRGTIAMARMNDKDSATAQFFINVVDNPMLDYRSPSNFGYAVFGEVTSGMDVVDKIRNAATGDKGHHQNVPLEPIVINSITKQ